MNFHISLFLEQDEESSTQYHSEVVPRVGEYFDFDPRCLNQLDKMVNLSAAEKYRINGLHIRMRDRSWKVEKVMTRLMLLHPLQRESHRVMFMVRIVPTDDPF